MTVSWMTLSRDAVGHAPARRASRQAIIAKQSKQYKDTCRHEGSVGKIQTGEIQPQMNADKRG